MAEEELELALGEAREAMEKSLDSLIRELAKVRTGRANPVLLDTVSVDYYGNPTPLRTLATVSAPEARLLVIQPFDPGSREAIERAILKADLGLTPNSDGKVIRIPIPELTEERRRDLVKAVKRMAEDHKVGVRNGRRDAVSMLKDLQKDGDVTEDESRHGQRRIQELTDEYIGRIDETVAAKEREILTL